MVALTQGYGQAGIALALGVQHGAAALALAAAALVRGALELARAQGYKVIPRCSFITAFIRKHPEFQDLVVEGAA